MPRLSKKFALLLVLAMLASMFVGMGTVSASSTAVALTIPTLIVNPAAGQSLGTIQITETTIGSIGATVPEQIVVTLPAGSRFVNPAGMAVADLVYVPPMVGAAVNGLAPANIVLVSCTNSTAVLQVNARADATKTAVFNLLFNTANSQVLITAGSADFKVNILDTLAGVTSGDVINAHVAVGGTSSYALSAPTRSLGPNAAGTIRIVENMAGALAASTWVAPLTYSGQTITLTLPPGVTFNGAPGLALAGGFAAGSVLYGGQGVDTSGRSQVTYWIGATSAGLPGIIDITPNIIIDQTATKGDIVVTIGGTNQFITPNTVVCAKYGTYGITASCADPTSIYAGRVDVKIGTIVMSENVAATLVGTAASPRTLDLELPDGCRWVVQPIPVVTKSAVGLAAAGIPAVLAQRVASYTNNAQSAGVASTVEFRQGTVSIPADFAPGDLTVTFGGTAGAVADDGSKVSVKVATIVAPITLTGATPSPTVIIGKQTQADTGFEIVEAGVGAIAANYLGAQQSLLIQTPPGVYFAALPTISVTGDLKLNTNAIRLNTVGNLITIPITTSSVTTASTIKFANVNYTLDRTVPEGPMKLTATGGAVDWWPLAYAWVGVNNWTTSAEGQVANVTTPAPDQQDKTATFVVGQSKFTLEGVEMTMDVAPYIKDGRTFLPIAYVAQALGIDASNIIWDAANQTITLMKADKVLQLKIGSTTMLVNGAAITLDAAPEINNSRTCLPVALVAKAFLQVIEWDAATQTVTINP